MKIYVALSLVAMVLNAPASGQRIQSDQEAKDQLIKAGICNHIVCHESWPVKYFHVEWNNTKAQLGNQASASDVQQTPNFYCDGIDPQKNYAVLIADIDPLGCWNNALRSVNYGLKWNVTTKDCSDGEWVREPMLPTPLYETRYHRNVFFVLEIPKVGYEGQYSTAWHMGNRVYDDLKQYNYKFNASIACYNHIEVTYDPKSFVANVPKLTPNPFSPHIERAIGALNISAVPPAYPISEETAEWP